MTFIKSPEPALYLVVRAEHFLGIRRTWALLSVLIVDLVPKQWSQTREERVHTG